MMKISRLKVAALVAGVILIPLGIGTAIEVARSAPLADVPKDAAVMSEANPTSQPTATQAVAAGLVSRVAHLSDGTSVELFGINDNPDDGKSGWGVDGGPLDVPFTGVSNRMHDDNHRTLEFGLRFAGTDQQKRPWNTLNIQWKGSDSALGLGVIQKNGKVVPHEFVLLGLFAPELDRTNVTIRLARKAAQVIARVQANAAGSKNAGDIDGLGRFELSNPREIDGSAIVTADIPALPQGWQVVVIAAPRGSGFILPAEDSAAIGGTDGKPKDIQYNGNLANVKKFRVEVRDFTTSVEFQNIPLVAGTKTDFKIAVHETPPLKIKAEEQGL